MIGFIPYYKWIFHRLPCLFFIFSKNFFFSYRFYTKIKDNKLDRKYFPKSKVDGSPLTNWIRGSQFLEDERYNYEYQKINKFLVKHKGEILLFLEMGVGRITPMFIQEPFWAMTQYMKNSFYININPKDATTNPAI